MVLFILAAGMGSRYGGLKQLDSVGPSGETIMDYSVFDALRAGFDKLVFVIRKDFEKDFDEIVLSRYKNHVPCTVVFQDVNDLPEGFTCPEGRTKPWGTNHAVMMAEDVIHEPFAVINADDFYGRHSFEVLAEELRRIEGKEGEYCMVGYRIGNTLSESGTVSRGICNTDSESYLTHVVERTDIARDKEGKIVFTGDNGEKESVGEKTPVSMNMWGFTPDYFKHSRHHFVEFLKENINTPKGEFYIPYVVNKLIQNNEAKCKVLDTTSHWFGVTYAEDKPDVVKKIQALVDAGEYPKKLIF